MLLMDWNSGGERGYVLGDAEGCPTRVGCSSGSGSYEAGAEYPVEEVVFSPMTQRTVRESCGESEFPKLLLLLDRRKMPEGMYSLPQSVRDVIPERFSAVLPNWPVIFEEPIGGGRSVLMRYANGTMAWATVDKDQVWSFQSIIEGREAQVLDAGYSFRFSDAEKGRIQAELVKGADGLCAMRKLFGDDFATLQLLSEVTDSYNNWTKREWRVPASGIIHVAVNGEGGIEYSYLMENGDAYVKLLTCSAV